MIHYMDSSAWLKRYFVEPGSGTVQRLFSEEGNTLVACRLGMVEVACAIARRAARENIDDAAIERQVAIARRDFALMVQVELSESLWASSELLGAKHKMRAADAVHLAACLIARSQLGEIAMVSSDAELIAAAASEGMPVLRPTGE